MNLDALRKILGSRWVYLSWRRLCTVVGSLHFATRLPRVKAEHIRRLLKKASPGDVILRKYNGALDNLFIPGKYSHSGIVVDREEMIHAVGEGVCRIDMLDFVLGCDGFALCRPYYPDSTSRDEAVGYARSQLGGKYDYLFDFSPDAFYCHELTYASMIAGAVVLPDEETPEIVTADDVMDRCVIVMEV